MVAGATAASAPARTAELRATASDLVLMLYRRLPVPDTASYRATRCWWPRSCRWPTPRDRAHLPRDGQLPGSAGPLLEQLRHGRVGAGGAVADGAAAPAPLRVPGRRHRGGRGLALPRRPLLRLAVPPRRRRPSAAAAARVYVVGPPGIEAHLANMNEAGAVRSVTEMAHGRGSTCASSRSTARWQEAGPLRFRAVEVVHVPYLRCFGYLFDRG